MPAVKTPKILCVIDYSIGTPNPWMNAVDVFKYLKTSFGDEIEALMPIARPDSKSIDVAYLDLHNANEAYLCDFYNQSHRLNYFSVMELINQMTSQTGFDPKDVQTVLYCSELAFFHRGVFRTFPNATPLFASFSNRTDEFLKEWSADALKKEGLDQIQIINVQEAPSWIEKYHLEKELNRSNKPSSSLRL